MFVACLFCCCCCGRGYGADVDDGGLVCWLVGLSVGWLLACFLVLPALMSIIIYILYRDVYLYVFARVVFSGCLAVFVCV